MGPLPTQRTQWEALARAGWTIDVGTSLWPRLDTAVVPDTVHDPVKVVRTSVGSVATAGLTGPYSRLPFEIRSRQRESRRLDWHDDRLRQTRETIVHSDVVSVR
jgi:hypothetical protein